MPLFYFYTPWKQKTRRFRIFPGGIERDQFHEMELTANVLLTVKSFDWFLYDGNINSKLGLHQRPHYNFLNYRSKEKFVN